MTKITGPSIQLRSGGGFNPLEPDPASIHIEDIAHALSNQCRFAGHVRDFYSVAQHSVLCCRQVLPPESQLAMLMHDASEAYLVDLPRPLKAAFPQYAEIEDRLMEVIAGKYGFQWPMTEAMKLIDNRMLFTEKRDLMEPADWGYEVEPYGDYKIVPWNPTTSERAFLVVFEQLTGL